MVNRKIVRCLLDEVNANELLRKFCLRGIVFSGGKLIFDGKIEEALSFYEEYDH